MQFKNQIHSTKINFLPNNDHTKDFDKISTSYIFKSSGRKTNFLNTYTTIMTNANFKDKVVNPKNIIKNI